MKYLPSIVSALLGLLFVAASIVVLFNLVQPQPEDMPPEGSPAALFMGAMGPTGMLTLVKVCELAGGLLVIIPRTRNIGLLFLGPIIVNILAFHALIAKDLTSSGGTIGMLAFISLAPLYLLWVERKAWAGLVRR
jgi:putative oxidoreductase